MICYGFSKDLDASTATNKSEIWSHWFRVLLLFAAILQGIGYSICEIANMGYMSFYPKSATLAYSTGGGIGAVIASLIPYITGKFINKKSTVGYISVGICYIFPLITFLVYFFILPKRDEKQEEKPKQEVEIVSVVTTLDQETAELAEETTTAVVATVL